MIDSKLLDGLNDQINAEFYSAYIYLSMAACFEDANLAGLASWMRLQAQEEMAHGMKFFDYIHERGAKVTLKSIAEPPAKWDSPLEAFKAALEHEQYVTGRINDLVAMADQARDYATNSFLRWFVDEQVEEEASAEQMVRKLEMVADSPSGLYMVDREAAQRKQQNAQQEGE